MCGGQLSLIRAFGGREPYAGAAAPAPFDVKGGADVLGDQVALTSLAKAGDAFAGVARELSVPVRHSGPSREVRRAQQLGFAGVT